LKIVPGNFEDPRVISMLRLHLQGMHANSPPGSVYALDLSGLKAPNISFFTAWEEDALVGMGALKEIDSTSGEIKSMRTDPKHLRKGVATALLEHLITTAKSRGYRRLSLETGSGPAFEPGVALYRKRGLTNGRQFGEYIPTEFNQFLHLDLQ
jgi:putative acetyltransferase